MKETIINIITATEVADYRIRLVFNDNTVQEIDFKPFLTRSHHPDIRAYLEPTLFSGFRVEFGELVWGDYALCFPTIDLYKNRIEHDQSMTHAA